VFRVVVHDRARLRVDFLAGAIGAEKADRLVLKSRCLSIIVAAVDIRQDAARFERRVNPEGEVR
jgi:hypothetical protein